MEKIILKGRIRLKRGILKSFYDLPEEKQENFKKIKEEINSYYCKEVPVYFFGSYINGNWDEFSDYDIIVEENEFDEEYCKKISNKLGIKISVFLRKNFDKTILIP
jgi:predicted nucleotidyltransferase